MEIFLLIAIALLLWLSYRSGRTVQAAGDILRFFRFYRAAMAPVLRPLAGRFWSEAARSVERTGDQLRRVYTGNGQTYGLFVLYYVVVLHMLGAAAPP